MTQDEMNALLDSMVDLVTQNIPEEMNHILIIWTDQICAAEGNKAQTTPKMLRKLADQLEHQHIRNN